MIQSVARLHPTLLCADNRIRYFPPPVIVMCVDDVDRNPYVQPGVTKGEHGTVHVDPFSTCSSITYELDPLTAVQLTVCVVELVLAVWTPVIVFGEPVPPLAGMQVKSDEYSSICAPQGTDVQACGTVGGGR